MLPWLAGTRPRTARMSVVLPAPFGPSTPTNSRGAIFRLTPSSTARPPSLNVTLRNSIAFMGLLGERLMDAIKLAQHPTLVTLAGRFGLGRPDDGDVRRSGDLHHPICDRVRGL